MWMPRGTPSSNKTKTDKKLDPEGYRKPLRKANSGRLVPVMSQNSQPGKMGPLDTPLKGVIGDRTALVFEKAFGYKSAGDLLRHYPRRYVMRGELSDISELKEGDEATVIADIKKVNLRRASGRVILEVIITDGVGEMSLTFFNQAWREKQLKVGMRGMFAGKVGIFNKKRQLSHPDYEILPEGGDEEEATSAFAGKALPVYPATSKLPSWKIAQSIEVALHSIDEIIDPIPDDVLAKFNFPTLNEAFHSIHQPITREEADRARTRLTFDEALLLQLLLAQRKAQMRSLPATPRPIKSGGLVTEFESQLPFTFTDGQREVCSEIESDMNRTHPMHRLLQGEVGSGKTVVSLRAMLATVDSGGQAALLAPTEVLAMQHFSTINRILGPLAAAGTLGASDKGTRVALLTGSMSAGVKREVLAEIASGSAGIVIGTHALLSEGVDFHDLGLVVVDEQHRFGVEQRDALRAKAITPPHLLVMTATPIPRTVAMTVFGDLDVSTLRELPAGRPLITSHLVPALDKPHFLDRAWERIREEVSKGHQAYVVAARISATEAEEGAGVITARDREVAAAMGITFDEPADPKTMFAVEELAPELALGALKGLKVAPLHGRQTSELKEETMRAFSEGKIDVLVSTTVIEVGVDVPNASVMVIMNADRFGVSQLHQLRGRVGRGKVPGLCLFVTEAAEDSPAMDRLTAVASTLDGFELSRIDLEQRSEGDILGKSQSGTQSQLRLLRVLRDENLIVQAREVAISMIDGDPGLENTPELAAQLEALRGEEAASYLDKG